MVVVSYVRGGDGSDYTTINNNTTMSTQCPPWDNLQQVGSQLAWFFRTPGHLPDSDAGRASREVETALSGLLGH